MPTIYYITLRNRVKKMIIQENPEVVASKKICTRTTHIATSEHLASLDYKNSLPLKTPMFIVARKEALLLPERQNTSISIGRLLYFLMKLPSSYSEIQ